MTDSNKIHLDAPGAGEPSQDALVYSVRETARRLKLSESGLRDAITRGEIKAIRIGRRILIPKHLVEKLVNGG